MTRRTGYGKPRGAKPLPGRRDFVISTLKKHKEPFLLSKFVDEHVTDMGLEDTTKGRHAATVYINRMVSSGILGKIKKGRYPYIYVPDPKDLARRTASRSSHFNQPEVRLDERQEKLVQLLSSYNRPVMLSTFISRHVNDFGYINSAQNCATLRSFIYRMADKKIVNFSKIENSVYISKNGDSDFFPGPKESETLSKAIVKPVTTKDDLPAESAENGPQDDLILSLTTSSLESLLEIKNSLIRELEELDNQIEQIVEKKKTLRIKRDELLQKIRNTL